jgi:hypothetical protein
MNAMMALQGPHDRRALSGNTWTTRNEAEIDSIAGADTQQFAVWPESFKANCPEHNRTEDFKPTRSRLSGLLDMGG